MGVVHGKKVKTIEETIRICKDRHILKSYLEKRESEIKDIMAYFMDQKTVMELTMQEQRQEGKEEEQINGIRVLTSVLKKYNVAFEDCLSEIQNEYSGVDASIIEEIVEDTYKK